MSLTKSIQLQLTIISYCTIHLSPHQTIYCHLFLSFYQTTEIYYDIRKRKIVFIINSYESLFITFIQVWYSQDIVFKNLLRLYTSVVQSRYSIILFKNLSWCCLSLTRDNLDMPGSGRHYNLDMPGFERHYNKRHCLQYSQKLCIQFSPTSNFLLKYLVFR